ncbi:MAG: FadR family transcriptional regulator [Leucobacter sp.]|nr:FadR family transcriptional regulator [Leucobacter sp.]
MNRKGGEKLYIQVFQKIRAYILQHNLQRGDLVPTEQALVDMLGVSRNVLREAIKSMELMGMAAAQPGRGTVLKEFNLDFVFQNVVLGSFGDEEKTIVDMLDIRKKLELAYMRRAYEALTEEDVVAIRHIMEEIKVAWEEHRTFPDQDRAFHMTIFSRIDNRILLSILEAIWDVDENYKTEEKVKHLDETISKHENIVKALEARNGEAFEAAMLAHFASGKYSRRDSFAEY